jgi:osmotically-inducible protein OsmY
MSLLRWSCTAVSTLLFATAFARAGILEDRAIEDVMESSYVFQHVLTDRSMVQVYVRSGMVELRGQVADERERQLVADLIAALPNVRGVDNQLFLDSANKRTDSRWRAQRIRAHLVTRASFDATRTRIGFEDGAWEITGEVTDEAQRDELTRTVRTLIGGENVRVNLRLVAPSSKVRPVDDPSIVAIVRGALQEFLAAGSERPAVESNQGAVILRGNCRSDIIRVEFARLAAQVRGVRSVDNQLTVTP